MTASRAWSVAGLAFAVSFGAGACLMLSPALAADDDAAQILKSMSNYLASAKTISATFDSDIEVITPEMEKIQFTSSGTLLLDRPNEIRATRTGGYVDVEMLFDGKTLVVYGKNTNGYVKMDLAGSVDHLIDSLCERGRALPGADLLLSNVYDTLIGDITDAKHIGRGVVGGVECGHLAFRQHDTDWQLWVELGEKPMPRKLVITSKTIAAAPQYSLVVRDWKTDVPVDAAAFTFNPPKGAKEVDEAALADLDELPPSAPAKGQ
ncbi:DUF2092 domain-containing protein [Mesorhizobium sp. BAC0120]|uniref:DUF2092 domain-containing protein n=1 Tax=Mesorhizobium sp. BAC0120 TaxID=3090670 RepID=UPI00298BF344|nr:DUF2092 domain-containing protein [Mesorhizobium sp. BAC0120]MDW6022874.1 DUF2092 domain-containing protein [Mesorhizobium sp. BAC0120]